MKLTLHTDPGHGWLETTFGECKRFGIVDSISPYSYVSRDKGDKQRVFLEEDCDASLLIEAMRGAGCEPDVRVSHSSQNSFVRDLPRWGRD